MADIPTPERGNDQNVRYLFNGDRLAFVKGYQRKKAKQLKASAPSIANPTDEQETP